MAGTLGKVFDSFQNFAARLGIGANNIHSQSQYGFDFITRNRTQLEAMYRTSWIVGQVVDVVAEDMTRAGVEIASVMPPNEIDQLQAALRDLGIWHCVSDSIRWSRLYGGAIAVMLIDGQDASTPLNIHSIDKGQFKGLLVLDRWLVQPSLNDLVTQLGPDLGKPKFYDVLVDAPAMPKMRIHHSRVLRIDGLDLPWFQRFSENGWGESVIERLHDRLIAFDSTTTGAAQLVYKAHLRVLKVEKLREIIATGGKAMEAVVKNVELIRTFQSNEGVTLLDSSDDFATHQYSFSGLSDVLLQFGQQLSGATGIPLVRLFGQSPAGLNSTGESDLRNYYDGISQKQEARLRRPLSVLLDVLCRSVLGKEPPQGFGFTFAPLWQLSDVDRATVANNVTTAVTGAFDAGLIDRATGLKELRQSSRATGVYSNITDQDIADAENEAPPLPEGEDVLALGGVVEGTNRENQEPPNADA